MNSSTNLLAQPPLFVRIKLGLLKAYANLLTPLPPARARFTPMLAKYRDVVKNYKKRGFEVRGLSKALATAQRVFFTNPGLLLDARVSMCW